MATLYEILRGKGRQLTKAIAEAEALGDSERVDELLANKDELIRMMRRILRRDIPREAA